MYCIFIYSPNGRNIFKIVLRKFSQKSLCWTLLFSKLTYTCSAESLIIASWARKMWLNWDLSKSFLLKGWKTGGPFNLPINYKKFPSLTLRWHSPLTDTVQSHWWKMFWKNRNELHSAEDQALRWVIFIVKSDSVETDTA